MEELHPDSIDGGHEASYGARSRARERAYSTSYEIGQELRSSELSAWRQTFGGVLGLWI